MIDPMSIEVLFSITNFNSQSIWTYSSVDAVSLILVTILVTNSPQKMPLSESGEKYDATWKMTKCKQRRRLIAKSASLLS